MQHSLNNVKYTRMQKVYMYVLISVCYVSNSMTWLFSLEIMIIVENENENVKENIVLVWLVIVSG